MNDELLTTTICKAKRAVESLGITFNNKPPKDAPKPPEPIQRPPRRKRGCFLNGDPFPTCNRMWIRYQIKDNADVGYWAIYLPKRPTEKSVWMGARATIEEAILFQDECLREINYSYAELFDGLSPQIQKRHHNRMNNNL
tara:strand:+ start:373 stop:792 length:420 start_codon:yes stop_codon:yes gene_type:complete